MPLTLSVAIIAYNEEAELPRVLASVQWAHQVVVVDSGSTDRTVELATAAGAQVTSQPWLGFAAQKNFAIEQCRGDWVLSLDADEELSPELASEIQALLRSEPPHVAYRIARRNHFLGRWMRHGGYYPDPKLRLFRRGSALFAHRAVHETMQLAEAGTVGTLHSDLLHHCYPTLSSYFEHARHYSLLAAQQALERPSRPWLVTGVLVNPVATFFYNYIFRGGFLDGPEGLLQHLCHSVYIGMKYAQAWELAQGRRKLAG